MRRFLRDNGLAIFFGLLFLGALVGQAIAGHIAYNAEQAEHGGVAISLGRYLTSSDFGQAVMENWQSEYLQFLLFILATVWLVQRGSPESKPVGKAGAGSDREQRVGRWAGRGAPKWARVGDWRTAIFGNSLLIVMGAIIPAVAVRAVGHRLDRLQRRTGPASHADSQVAVVEQTPHGALAVGISAGKPFAVSNRCRSAAPTSGTYSMTCTLSAARRHPLVGHSSQYERVDLVELLHREFVELLIGVRPVELLVRALVVPVDGCPYEREDPPHR